MTTFGKTEDGYSRRVKKRDSFQLFDVMTRPVIQPASGQVSGQFSRYVY